MNNRWRQIARVERLEKIKQAKKTYALFMFQQKDFSDRLNALRNAIVNVKKDAIRRKLRKIRKYNHSGGGVNEY